MKLSTETQLKLICPATKSLLLQKDDYLESTDDPNIRYPVVNGIPILINEDNSLFSISDFSNVETTTFDLSHNQNPFKTLIRKLLPSISLNIKAKDNFDELAALLPQNAKILIIGGSIQGAGMEAIYDSKSFEIVGSDVSFGELTDLICDSHDIPFADNTFDCIVIQAVLEHVLDPQRCVAEVHRTLKSSGVVYAETPFMQQVHMKQYDFTRFTHLGHRWLFKHFDEVNSGPCCGPGMALAWSFHYFLASFSSNPKIKRILTLFAQLTAFIFKYFDYYLIDRPGSYDAASGYYFIGKKSDTCLQQKELIEQFKGEK